MRKIAGITTVILMAIYLCGCSAEAKNTDPPAPVTKPAAAQRSNPVSDDNPLRLEPAPWRDGEMMKLKMSSLQADEIGVMFYLAERDSKDSGEIWRITGQNYITTSDSQQYSIVETGVENFRPAFSHTANLLGDFTAQYQPGKVRLENAGAAGETKRDVDVNSPVYDNEQLVHLVRRLPLREGFKASFKLFMIMGGQIVDCNVAVVGKESVAVQAGTFDCYRVNLSMRSGDEKPVEHALWISADRNRYLTKYIAGMSMILELVEVTQAEKGTPVTFENDELSCEVTVPHDWRFYKHMMGKSVFLEMLAPQLKAKAVLCILSVPGGGDPAEIAKRDVQLFRKIFTGYAVRGNDFKQVSAGSLKAVQFTADLLEEANAARKYPQPKELVEYRTYMVSEDNVYFFVFRAEKDKFANLKSEFDAIIQSLEVKRKTQTKQDTLSVTQ